MFVGLSYTFLFKKGKTACAWHIYTPLKISLSFLKSPPFSYTTTGAPFTRASFSMALFAPGSLLNVINVVFVSVPIPKPHNALMISGPVNLSSPKSPSTRIAAGVDPSEWIALAAAIADSPSKKPEYETLRVRRITLWQIVRCHQ